MPLKGIINKVLEGHSGVFHVTIGQVGSMALGAIFWLVLARILLPNAFGQLNWLISIATLASIFCILGWGRTVTTYYPKEKKDELIGGSVGMVLLYNIPFKENFQLLFAVCSTLYAT